MSQFATVAHTFAWSGGDPDETKQTLCADFGESANGWRLVAAVEPLEPTAHGLDVAGRALEALRASFLESPAPDLAAALWSAFGAANQVVREANQYAPGWSVERRVYVGATAVAIAGAEMVVAQAAPGQLIVVQGGQLFAFPDLRSWRPDYLPDSDEPTSDPLGLAERARPALHSTIAAPGDRIIVTSSAIGRCLGRADDAEVLADPTRDIGATLAELECVARDLDLDLAHVLCLTIDQVAAAETLAEIESESESEIEIESEIESETATVPISGERPAETDDTGLTWMLARARARFLSGAPMLHRVSLRGLGVPLDRELDPADFVRIHDGADILADSLVEPAVVDDQDPVHPADPDIGPRQEEDLVADATIYRPRAPLGGMIVDASVQRADWLDRIQLGFIAACERLAPARNDALALDAAHSPALSAPGAGSIHVYRNRFMSPISPALRAQLPRGPMVHLPWRIMAIFVALLLLVGAAAYAYNWREDRQDRVSAYLATVDSQLAAAAAADDVAAAEAELAAAEVALDNARGTGAGAKLVAAREVALIGARDRLGGVTRLKDVTRLGTLPPELHDKPVRLVRVGSDVYLIAESVYHVDAAGGALTKLLEPGMKIGKAPVRALTDATVNEGKLAVTDGRSVFTLGFDGKWTRKKLGVIDEKTPWPAERCGAFQGSFYLLDGEVGQILKFEAERYSSLPEDWAGAESQPDLEGAVDMVVDGRIHVLLPDGIVRSFYRGAVQQTIEPGVAPALHEPIALDGGIDTNFLYVADRGADGGRIVRFDRDGGSVRQYLLPVEGQDDYVAGASDALARVDDLVVDEANGLLYFFNDGELWMASIPSANAVV